jgi:hypothetical protein
MLYKVIISPFIENDKKPNILTTLGHSSGILNFSAGGTYSDSWASDLMKTFQ